MNTTTTEWMKLEDAANLAQVRFANATEDYHKKTSAYTAARRALYEAEERGPQGNDTIQGLKESLELATVQYRDANSEYILAEKAFYQALADIEEVRQLS